MSTTEVACRIELSASKIDAAAKAMEDVFPLRAEEDLERLYALVLMVRDNSKVLMELVGQV